MLSRALGAEGACAMLSFLPPASGYCPFFLVTSHLPCHLCHTSPWTVTAGPRRKGHHWSCKGLIASKLRPGTQFSFYLALRGANLPARQGGVVGGGTHRTGQGMETETDCDPAQPSGSTLVLIYCLLPLKCKGPGTAGCCKVTVTA